MVQKFGVTGMMCSACTATVDRVVNKLEGINQVEVDLEGKSMTVDFDETRVKSEEISKAVYNAGFDVECM